MSVAVVASLAVGPAVAGNAANGSASRTTVGTGLVLGGGAVAVLARRLLCVAWSFTAGVRPRADVAYERPLSWFVRTVRAVGAAFALAGLALVALGAAGGGGAGL